MCKCQLLSRVQLFVILWSIACQAPLYPWDSPGKNTLVGCRSLLQGIFLTQGSNPGVLQSRQILYSLSHQGSYKIQCSVQLSLSCVRLFVTPWTAACQASLSIANSQSLLKLMSIEAVMPSNHLSTSVIPFSSCLQSLLTQGLFQ